MTPDIVIAQTTVDDAERARLLAHGAVEEGLAACAHVDAPLTAVYRWKGSVETGTEWRISYKTARDRLPALAEWVARTHPYEVPEWIVLPVVGGSAAYLGWVERESRQP
ncbi:divalent-cation tolerance protein CutA [Streptomyces sp. NPDC090077]|uniref:divalent-cation tolerance protein CutA n=1 Tax=Streptomyces sp. NPDC090077 TaxID=3365938 RepID=UPI0037F97D48